ncbi:hypothetical protein WJX74_010240 [Apatococcus lobatus]|uniref:VPS37 C-terminal domain-containing protein n=2 Tax=Apatococcus TaxID=904362 RepID=A0AAW1TK52_9CHLO
MSYPSVQPPGASPTPFRHSPERLQQVQDLLAQVSYCRALNRDQSLFEAPLRMRDGRTTNLRISLPPNFPQGRPGLSIIHPIQHPCVDTTGRLSLSSLDRWPSSHIRLVDVVQDAFTALSGQPSYASPVPSRPGSAGFAQDRAHSPDRPIPGPGRLGQQSAPMPRSFPELQEMSLQELSDALTSPEAYTALAGRLVKHASALQVSESMRTQAREMAENNLAQEQVMGELRNQIAIIRSSEYAAAKHSFDEVFQRQQTVLDKLAPSSLVAALKRAVDESDAASEKVYDAFQAGERPVEPFIDEYTKLRTIYHSRELKRLAAQQMLVS